jgi:hypothetical protein
MDADGNNTPTLTMAFGACPTSDVSGNTCTSSAYVPFVAFNSVALSTSSVIDPVGMTFDITATGTAGTFVVTMGSRPVGAMSNYSPAAGSTIVSCAACASGAWNLVFGTTFSATATQATCNGQATSGTNCLSQTGAQWTWIQ